MEQVLDREGIDRRRETAGEDSGKLLRWRPSQPRRLLSRPSSLQCQQVEQVNYADFQPHSPFPPIPRLISRFKVAMEQFPTINRIMTALESLEAFKAAHPTKQPDCPAELR